MHTREDAWASVLECNRIVWSRLLAWEMLLFQFADDRYRSDSRFTPIVQFACQLFERDLDTSFTIEESGLYAHVEAEVPKLRKLIQQLRQEHYVIREHLKLIHLEFGDEVPLDRLELLRASVADLAEALRAHMLREEEELVPALGGSPSEAALARMGPRSVTEGSYGTRHVPEMTPSEDVA